MIVDEHPATRAGLRSSLQGDGEFEIVGEAASGAEALGRVQDIRPDVVLIDVNRR